MNLLMDLTVAWHSTLLNSPEKKPSELISKSSAALELKLTCTSPTVQSETRPPLSSNGASLATDVLSLSTVFPTLEDSTDKEPFPRLSLTTPSVSLSLVSKPTTLFNTPEELILALKLVKTTLLSVTTLIWMPLLCQDLKLPSPTKIYVPRAFMET